MPTAIEELLRFDTPLSLFERWVLEPVEVDGVDLPRGRGRAALRVGEPRCRRLRAARRSRSRRDPNPYLSFGAGIHYCLGRRWRSSSSGSPSRRCSGACRGSSSSRRLAGSRPSSCAGSRRCASGSDPVRYVALGDSYTIGTSVPPADRWPDQLVRALGPAEPTLELVANLGVNGYTSADLVRTSCRRSPPSNPASSPCSSASTTSSGVSRSSATRPTSRRSSTRCWSSLPADRIMTVATPDYTVTPAGADYGDPRRQHDGIVAVNETLARLAADRGIAHVDIFDLSLRAADGPACWSRDDGLHPSGAQYATWVERILPVVEGLLGALTRPGYQVAALELVEPLVGDPEMVGDLVVDRVGDGRREPFRRPVRADQRRPEDGDLARHRGAVGRPAGPRHALVEAVQPARPDATPAAPGVAWSSMTIATLPSWSRNGAGSALEGVDDHLLDVVVGRFGGQHRGPAARASGRPCRDELVEDPVEHGDRDRQVALVVEQVRDRRSGSGRQATRRGRTAPSGRADPARCGPARGSRRRRSPTA